ncbi:Predicted PurR-regulated permease PerM [Nonomuraea solani]|uniref:Predicted PurR-regulated permease PerM n=1 Tax=Nonomuraea solani TaxID=1144553 RepID=A0A1H5VUA5_9ACTN|nr:AI-2E family transporter [Nonomuraea solani]SEF90713.1 Predicted PurR-regulated permease PerM [Nonomuraea solani]
MPDSAPPAPDRTAPPQTASSQPAASQPASPQPASPQPGSPQPGSPQPGSPQSASSQPGSPQTGDGALPFGRPGRPFGSTPFTFGFTAALGVLTAWLLVQALTVTASVLLLIVVSLFLAVGLDPAVRWLHRHGLPRWGAIAAVFAAVILFFAGFGMAVIPALSQQAGQFVEQLPGYIGQLQNHPQVRDLDQRFGLLERLQSYLLSGDLGRQVFGGLLGAAGVVVSAVFSALTVLILTLYFLASLRSITRTGYRLIPGSRRPRVQHLGDEILDRVGGYVAGNLIISLIAGVTTFVFLSILGVPYALALAIIVAVTDLIPMIGAGIGAAIATLTALFVSAPVAIGCLVFFIIYQQIENYLIAPKVMKSSVDVPAAVTIVAALIGGALLGVVGALLAIPVAAAIQLILSEVVLPRQDRH